jgi:hypothetical protein
VNQELERTQLQRAVLRVVVYYDIWQYPLSEPELHTFLPMNSVSYEEFRQIIRATGPGSDIGTNGGYYYLGIRGPSVVERRLEKEKHAGFLWHMARLSTHIIKRFPFVRAVFVSGDLSKNATGPGSDVDFFIITAPGRLWITRTLLILFKKIFLLNSKKYFCLNSFITEDHLEISERNLFLATEIAHLKPLYNSTLFRRYLEANDWIRSYFPNLDLTRLSFPGVNNRRSLLQQLFELPFHMLPARKIDTLLMSMMKRVWEKRYPHFDRAKRDRVFRSTPSESRAYVGDFQEKILLLYAEKCRSAGLETED